MKKNVKRIIAIIFVLLLGKVLVENVKLDWIAIIPILNLIIYIVLFSLKLIFKENENIKNKVNILLYICEVISILVYMFSAIIFEFTQIMIVIPIILFIILIIIRLKENKKISNIISIILIGFIYIVAIISYIKEMKIEDYNENFERYIEYDVLIQEQYTRNIEGFVKTAMKSNASNRKVSIWYEEEKYTSIEELEDLLNKLDINTEYSINIEYDKNENYIEKISINEYISREKKELSNKISKYDGNVVSGASVKSLISEVYSWAVTNDKQVTIIYNSVDIETQIINLNSESRSNLIKEISSSERYTVEIKFEKDVAYISITSN